MLDKINNINPWFIAIGIAISLEVLFSLLATMIDFDMRSWISNVGYMLSVPALKIVGYETVQAINEFGGKAKDITGIRPIVITTGLGMFMIFILIPFLLLKGYQQADKADDPKQRSWTWYAGAILIIASIFPVSLSSTVGTKVFMNTIESAQSSRELDRMRSELMDLAFDASYRLFLPVELGGGNGSFHGFGDGSQTITLEDLESYSPDSPFEFQIQGEVSDSSFTIVAVSDNPGKSADFENVTGAIGKQQVSVEVQPYEESIYRMQYSGHLSN